MFEPQRVPLDFLESILIDKKQLTEDEIKQELYKSPYTREEVDEYLTSEQRGKGILIKTARERVPFQEKKKRPLGLF